MSARVFQCFAILLVVIVIEVTSVKDSGGKTYQSVELFNDKILLKCNKDVSLDNTADFSKITEEKTIREVIIDSCAPPNGSYADILKTINVSVADIKKLVILNPQLSERHENSTGPDPKRPKSQHFDGLELLELQILNNETSVLGIDLDFLKDKSLKKLTLNKVEIWSPIPNSSKIEALELTDAIFHENIGECSKLKVLNIINVELIGDQQRWLENCLKLKELKLENLSSDTSDKILMRLSHSISNITARNCSVDTYPDRVDLIKSRSLRIENKVLRHLDVSHNNIRYGPRYTVLRGLETLDLSYNKMTYFDKHLLYSDEFTLPHLREIKLDGNNFSGICQTDYGITRIRQRKDDDWKYHKDLDAPLRRLSLSNTGLPYLCFGDVLVPHLEFLDVSHNSITELDYRTFYWTSSDHLEVDMRQNPLKKVAFTKEDYQSIKRNDPAVSRWSKITVLTDAQLSCDCSVAWFARALGEGLLTVEGVKCDDGTPIVDRAQSWRSC